MPQADLLFPAQVSTLLPSVANNCAGAGMCSKGDPTRRYTYDPGQLADVSADLGDGELVEWGITQLKYGRRRVTLFPLTPSTQGAISAISKNGGTGPTITAAAVAAAGALLIAGPYDSLHVAVRIVKGGIEGVAEFQWCVDDQVIDGVHVGSWSGNIVVPAAQPAELVGSVALTPAALFGDGGTLDTLTFIVDSDSATAATTTFADPADAAGVASQVDATGASTKYNADIVGDNKLRVQSVTTGLSGTLLLGSGTANAALGFADAATATGSAATYTIPGIGVTLTFPAGTYVGPTTAAPTTAINYYTFDTTAPRVAPAAVAALHTRIQTAITGGASVGVVHLIQEDGDTIDGRSMMDAQSSALTTARGLKFLYSGLYQATKTAADSDVLLRMSTFVDQYLLVSAGDFRSAGGALPGARFHRPVSWLAARKAARDRFSSDLGNHEDGDLSDLGCTAIGRDERKASTKLATFRTPQTGSGGGFLVLETLANSGEVYFYQGRSMAANGSTYGDWNAVRVLLASARQLQRDLDFVMNSDPPLTKAGALTASAKATLANRFRTGLQFVLFEDPEAPDGHASAIGAIDPLYTVATKTLSATFAIQRRGPVKAIMASIGVTDTLTTQEA